MIQHKSIIVLFIGVLSLLGCTDTPTRKMVVECKFPIQGAPQGPAMVAQVYGDISSIPLNAVQYVDQSLIEILAVQSLKTSRTSTNTVKVSARLVNCSDFPLVVGIRTHFLDRDQVSLEKETAWQNVVIQPYSLGNYTESSLRVEVSNYLLEIRDAR